ncbi:MAG: GNAT family N-acetyltransferase [Chthoniobacter sp.]|uniref:GNAT family N-acetyltransferase n=1 Tax=Chthoniobacter sp. TaxID=2510640 RepID=UPI0032AA36E7
MPTPLPSSLIRAIRADELPGLLELYRHLHPADPALPVNPDLTGLWQRICADPQLHYLAADVGGALVATCTLAIIPNLTRAARPYGLVENVVTHPGFRRRGIATALLRHALQLAWTQGCYKVMLLTGRKDEATLRFYEKAGFQAGVKMGFIATP